MQYNLLTKNNPWEVLHQAALHWNSCAESYSFRVYAVLFLKQKIKINADHPEHILSILATTQFKLEVN